MTFSSATSLRMKPPTYSSRIPRDEIELAEEGSLKRRILGMRLAAVESAHNLLLQPVSLRGVLSFHHALGQSLNLRTTPSTRFTDTANTRRASFGPPLALLWPRRICCAT